MLSSRVAIRRRLLSATLALAIVGTAGIAPGSPVIAEAEAAGCWVLAHGGRSTNTSAWAWGELSCTGYVSLFTILQYQHCDFDIAGACLVWGPLVAIYSKNVSGTGYFRTPNFGTIVVGGLADEHLYHIRLAISGTIGGKFATGDNYTPQFRL